MVLDFTQSQLLCPEDFSRCKARNDSNPSISDSKSHLWKSERNDSLDITRTTRSRQGPARVRRLKERGFGTLGAALSLLAVVVGLALAKKMYGIRDVTRTQVSLDRCTGVYAIHLRAATLAMEYSYTRLDGYRAGVLGVCAATLGAGCPDAIKVFNQIAKLERTLQNAVKLYWKTQSLEWNSILGKKCDLPIFVFRAKFPEFPFEIIKDGDYSILDLKASKLNTDSPQELLLELNTFQLSSAAEIKKQRGLNDWAIYWTK